MTGDPTLGGILGPRPAEARCDCCDLPVFSCGKAVEQRQRAAAADERRRALAHPAHMAAQYGGTCAGCGERFDVGDPIRRVSDGLTPNWTAVLCCGGRP